MRIQTVGNVNEFLSGEYKFRKILNKTNKRLLKVGIKVAVTVLAGSIIFDVTLPALAIQEVFAAQPEAVPVSLVGDKFGESVGKALQPLIDVLKDLARPIAGVMVTWGCLRYMIGQRDAGIGNIQQAAVGYILVMLSPMILNLITGVGSSIA